MYLTTKHNSATGGGILWLVLAFLAASCASSKQSTGNGPMVVQEQGSFAVGGTVITATGTFDPIKDGAFNPVAQSTAGQTLHGDHAYVFYQIPTRPRKLPLVFWHGHGQSTKTWETTPDGREGFQTISCAIAFRFTYLTSRGVAGLREAQSP